MCAWGENLTEKPPVGRDPQLNIHHIRYAMLGCLCYCRKVVELETMFLYVMMTAQVMVRYIGQREQIWNILDVMVDVVGEDMSVTEEPGIDPLSRGQSRWDGHGDALLALARLDQTKRRLLFLRQVEGLDLAQITEYLPGLSRTELALAISRTFQQFTENLAQVSSAPGEASDKAYMSLERLRHFLERFLSNLAIRILLASIS